MLVASYICFVVGAICLIFGFNISYAAWFGAFVLFVIGAIVGRRSWVLRKKFLNFLAIFLNILGIAAVAFWVLMLFLLTGFA